MNRRRFLQCASGILAAMGVGCGSKEATRVLKPLMVPQVAPAIAGDLLTRLADAWNQKSVEAFDAVLTADYRESFAIAPSRVWCAAERTRALQEFFSSRGFQVRVWHDGEPQVSVPSEDDGDTYVGGMTEYAEVVYPQGEVRRFGRPMQLWVRQEGRTARVSRVLYGREVYA